MPWSLQQINGKQPTVENEPLRCPGTAALGFFQQFFVCTFGSQQHFAFVDTGGALLDCCYDRDVQPAASQWNCQAITGADGLFPDAPLGGQPFVSVFGDELHFSYVDGNNDVQDFCFSGGAVTSITNWKQRQINAGIVANAPKVGSGPAVFVSTFQGQLHFTYVDVNNNIQDCFYDGAGSEDDPNHWHLQQINEGDVTTVSGELVACPGAPAAGALSQPIPAVLFVSTFENEQHFTYADAQFNLQDCVYDGDANTWEVRQLTGGSLPESSPAPSADSSGTGIFVGAFGSQQHFVYVDNEWRLQDLFFDSDTNPPASGWALQQIVGTGAPNIPGEPIVCPDAPPLTNPFWFAVVAYTGLLQSRELHFVYLDEVGWLQDCYSSETSEFQGWELRQINGIYPDVPGESIVCSSAPTGGQAFVSVFGDELHYTYVDSNNALQDVVWSPSFIPRPVPHI
jgi:hypothetical protein